MYLLLLPPLLITVVTLRIEVMCGACPVDLMQAFPEAHVQTKTFLRTSFNSATLMPRDASRPRDTRDPPEYLWFLLS